MDILDAIDWGAYAHFRSPAGYHPTVARVLQVVSAVGTSDALLGVLVVLMGAAYLARGRYRAAWVALGVFLVAALAAGALQAALGRERPPDAQEQLAPLGPTALAGSFPATHVLLLALVAAQLVFATSALVPRRGLRALAVGGAALVVLAVAFSQLYLGLHFVTDVVAGLAGGLAAALVGRALAGAPPAGERPA